MPVPCLLVLSTPLTDVKNVRRGPCHLEVLPCLVWLSTAVRQAMCPWSVVPPVTWKRACPSLSGSIHREVRAPKRCQWHVNQGPSPPSLLPPPHGMDACPALELHIVSGAMQPSVSTRAALPASTRRCRAEFHLKTDALRALPGNTGRRASLWKSAKISCAQPGLSRMRRPLYRRPTPARSARKANMQQEEPLFLARLAERG